MSKGSGTTRNSSTTIKLGNKSFSASEISSMREADERMHNSIATYFDTVPQISKFDSYNQEAYNQIKGDLDWVMSNYQKVERSEISTREDYEKALKAITTTNSNIGSLKVTYAEEGSYDILKKYRIADRPNRRAVANAKFAMMNELQSRVRKVWSELNAHYKNINK